MHLHLSHTLANTRRSPRPKLRKAPGTAKTNSPQKKPTSKTKSRPTSAKFTVVHAYERAPNTARTITHVLFSISDLRGAPERSHREAGARRCGGTPVPIGRVNVLGDGRSAAWFALTARRERRRGSPGRPRVHRARIHPRNTPPGRYSRPAALRPRAFRRTCPSRVVPFRSWLRS